MCFSPEASFATAALTASIGVFALARTRSPGDWALAAMPLFFGVQQAIEGGLWLVLPTAPHGPVAAALTLVFLVFAQVFWPIYAPLAAEANEPNRTRRRWMRVCLVIGVAVAAHFAWRLATGPHEAVILNRCISYRTLEPHPLAVGLVYLGVTCAPLVLSTQRTLFVLGLIVSTGALAAYLFYWAAFASVWCFFAALGSAVIAAHFEFRRRQAPRPAPRLQPLEP